VFIPRVIVSGPMFAKSKILRFWFTAGEITLIDDEITLIVDEITLIVDETRAPRVVRPDRLTVISHTASVIIETPKPETLKPETQKTPEFQGEQRPESHALFVGGLDACLSRSTLRWRLAPGTPMVPCHHCV